MKRSHARLWFGPTIFALCLSLAGCKTVPTSTQTAETDGSGSDEVSVADLPSTTAEHFVDATNAAQLSEQLLEKRFVNATNRTAAMAATKATVAAQQQRELANLYAEAPVVDATCTTDVQFIEYLLCMYYAKPISRNVPLVIGRELDIDWMDCSSSVYMGFWPWVDIIEPLLTCAWKS